MKPGTTGFDGVEWRYAALVALFTCLAASVFLTPVIPWGDDTAGYLLQARSLIEGRPAAEIALNAELQSGSDWRVGPDGYPWGYPLLLALVGPVVEWDMAALRLLNLPFYALAAGLAYFLARTMGFSRSVALLCTVLPVWDFNHLIDGNEMSSDAPFLALCLLALVYCWQIMQSPGIQPRRIVLLALVTLVSSMFRSNGYVCMAALTLALVMDGAGVLKPGFSRSGAVRAGLFLVISVLGTLAWFGALPDGSMVHATYLSFEWQSLLQRLVDHATTLGTVFPLNLLPKSLEPFAGCIVLLSSGWGALLDRRGILLGAYTAGHLALLTFFPVDAGIRYYYPVLPTLAMLCCIAWFDLHARLPLVWRALTPAMRFVPLVLLAGAIGHVAFRAGDLPRTDHAGPFSADMNEALAWLHDCHRCRTTAFDKPRMFRWRSGHRALVITDTASLDRVNSVLLRRVGGSRHQLSEEAVQNTGHFRLAHRNPGFSLYVRTR